MEGGTKRRLSSDCGTCGEYARFERLAPKGDVFACAECRKVFRRVRSNGGADLVLDLLVFTSGRSRGR